MSARDNEGASALGGHGGAFGLGAAGGDEDRAELRVVVGHVSEQGPQDRAGGDDAAGLGLDGGVGVKEELVVDDPIRWLRRELRLDFAVACTM
jgi:hypothetical protein